MLLRVTDLSKSYGAVTALDHVSVDIHPGEIHALLGENGAGKSSLASILAGFARPDGGSAEFLPSGRPLPFGRPPECKRLGVRMIHQHFTLVPEFTVEENLALAAVDSRGKVLAVRREAGPALEIGRALGWNLDPHAKVRTLAVGTQQRIEILKSLVGEGKVILFDEPTAVLSADEVEELMRVMRRLRDEGRGVVLIAHKLAEVMAVADRVSVLRKGRKVAEAVKGEFDASRLAEWMVGEIPQPGPRVSSRPTAPGFSAQELWVRGDRGEDAVRGVSFDIAPGEILGVGGVDGNGQKELAEAAARIRKQSSGEITSGARVGYIPQDRQADGLALTMSVADNLLVAAIDRTGFRFGPLLRVKHIGTWARELMSRFSIFGQGIDVPAGSLSGGNQQKVVVSRVLDSKPTFLVANSPTRGLDVAAAAYVREQIRQARNGGAAVLLLSTDLDELAELSDRTLFINGGRLFSSRETQNLFGQTL